MELTHSLPLSYSSIHLNQVVTENRGSMFLWNTGTNLYFPVQ